MSLWRKIKKFFSEVKTEESSENNDRGDLEAIVETVSPSEDDVSVELFELPEKSDFSPEEDPEIEVEIVASDVENVSLQSELGFEETLKGQKYFSGSADLRGENAECCGENVAECPSRMTNEYKQWLKGQNVQQNQPYNSTES